MNPFRILSGIALAAATFGMSGCLSVSKSADMVANVSNIVNKHPESLSVSVSSIRPPNIANTDILSTAEFTEAIKTSILQSGVFARTAATGAADYDLGVEIVRVDLPMMGFSMTVTMEATWRLMRRGDQKPVWQKAIMSTFTARASEAFAGATRVRLANEGAARENIKDAITQMGALTLP